MNNFVENILVFLFGTLWGSFFNVCIYRMPRNESVVYGRSHCPSCKKVIPWYLNIPIFSYTLLRAKCAYCRKRISFQYPFVELITGILFLLLYLEFGLSLQFGVYLVFTSALIVLSFIDIEHQIIPDEISLSGIPLGFVAALLTGDIPWTESLLGILIGGGSFFLVAFTYEKLSKKEGLGGGDIKLLAMLGAWLGYRSILPIIVISSLLGSIIGLLYMAVAKKGVKAAIPFGPFLAFAALLFLFGQQQILDLLFPPN